MTGLKAIENDILNYIKQEKNPYLTPTKIEQKRWLAGVSHCTIRELMRNGEIPSIKVGTAFKAHYLDVIEFIENEYNKKKV